MDQPPLGSIREVLNNQAPGKQEAAYRRGFVHGLELAYQVTKSEEVGLLSDAALDLRNEGNEVGAFSCAVLNRKELNKEARSSEP